VDGWGTMGIDYLCSCALSRYQSWQTLLADVNILFLLMI
jgi:hypothetical protein